MNIALIGYGTMGRAVESAAPQRGHTIVARFTSSSPLSASALTPLLADGLDCCIDFSSPQSVRSTVEILSTHGIPVVEGTTGWHTEEQEIRSLVQFLGGTMIYGSNFSVGAQMFFRIVERAAQLMNGFDPYDVAVSEVHHAQKKDSPSGTAHTLAGIIMKQIPRKRSLMQSKDRSAVRPSELNVASSRVGNVFGRHAVLFNSSDDEIELAHRAHGRTGFANGALLAAELIHNVSGVLSFEELIFDRSIHHSYT